MSEDNNKEKKSHTGIVAGIAAALAAGAVYFYGPEGDRHRRNFRGWILKTKGEVLDQLESAESVSKEKYHEIVDAAIAKYAVEKAKKEAEIETLREQLKGEWQAIKQRVEERGEELREAAAEEVAQQAENLSDNIAPKEE